MAPTERQTIDGLISLLQKAGAIRDVSNARLITDGMQNLVLVIDEELIARIPRDAGGRSALAEERQLLAHLKNHVSAPLPEPIAWADEFAIHRLLRGEPITRHALARLDRQQSRHLIDEVAQFLAEMHSAPLPDHARASPATKSPATWLELRDRADSALSPLLWRHQREWLDDLFRPVKDGELSFKFDPVVVHGDLASYHLLHDAAPARLTGVLDFGVAGLGDPAVDLACLLSVWGEGWAKGLARHYPELADLADRARFIAGVLPVEWAVIGLEQNQRDMLVAHLGHTASDLGARGTPFGL